MEGLCYYIGKGLDALFTLSSESLGYPLVQCMDESAAEAMWTDESINITQQQIVKRHLRYYFGKGVFIAENKIAFESNYHSVPTFDGEYKPTRMEKSLRNL